MILASHLPTDVGFHTPVLLPKVLEGLKIEAGKKYIDATLGGGGYAFEIVKLGGKVLGIDCDEKAIDYVKKNFIDKDLFLARGNFADLKKIAQKHGFDKVAGIVFDLGMSSFQLEESGKGFSYKKDEPLDMRMDERKTLSAGDIINKLCEEELYEIFTKFSEELYSRTIAHALFRARSLNGPIRSTGQLMIVVDDVLKKIYANVSPRDFIKIRRETQARIFQALRIAVNNELDNLKKGLWQALDLLLPKGRLAILSYHSLEDRIVKLQFKEAEKRNLLRVINKEPIKAEREERGINPKSRSAKLRIGEKYER